MMIRVVTVNSKPSGAPDAGWAVSIDGQATWTHYTGRGAVATYSTDAASPAAVSVTAPVTVTSCEVKLQQDGVWPPPTITPSFAGSTVTFTLPAGFYGHAMIRINNAVPPNDWQKFCVIGALPLETDVPTAGQVTYFFGPGVHTGAQIDMASNSTMYIAPGALVKRRVVAGQIGTNTTNQRTNLRIYGRGVLDTTNGYGSTNTGLGTADFAGVNGLTIEGITYVGRYAWSIATYRCTNVVGDRVRVYACEIPDAANYAAQGTPDGWDPVACNGFTLKRSMISASDDSSAIKASKYGEVGNVANHLYEDLMLIQGGKSNGTEIGYELGTQTVTGVTYRRVYIPICWRDTQPYRTNTFGIHVCTAATVDGVLYEDCRADEARDKEWDLFISTFYTSSGFGSASGDANRGIIKNVTYRRVEFPDDKPVRITADLTDPNYAGGTKKITNLTFEDCTRGGVLLTAPEADWTVTNVTNLQFTSTPPEPVEPIPPGVTPSIKIYDAPNGQWVFVASGGGGTGGGSSGGGGGTGGLDQTTADGLYVDITGDTVTGPLVLNNASRLITPLTINRTQAATTVNDNDTFVVNYLGERSTWTNEKGNLRTSNRGSPAEDAVKIIGAPSITGNHLVIMTDSGTALVRVGSAGTLIAEAGFRLTSGTLAAGRVLTSDASGNGTWQTPTGGGGLDQATADGLYVQNTGSEVMTGPLTFTNADRLVSPLVINRTVTSTTTSDAEIFRINYLGTRATWVNEKGNLRTSNDAARTEVAMKIIGASQAEGGTGNILEVTDVTGNIITRIGPLGRQNFNKGLRLVGDTIEIRDSTEADQSTISQTLGGSLTITPKTTLAVTGPVLLPASISAAAPLRIPHGAAPTAPVNGDMWTTTSGLFIRINGTTRQVTVV